jgi:hypothetical protein
MTSSLLKIDQNRNAIGRTTRTPPEGTLKNIFLVSSMVLAVLVGCSSMRDDPALDQNATAGSSIQRLQSGSYCCGTIASSNSCDRRFDQACAVRNDGRVFQVDVP